MGAPALRDGDVRAAGHGVCARRRDGRGLGGSDVPGIECGPACVGAFGAGVDVTLTPASYPVTWAGACTGGGACVVPMSRPRAVTASIGGAALTRVPARRRRRREGDDHEQRRRASTAGRRAARSSLRNTLAHAASAPLRRGMVFAGWTGSCRGVAPTCRASACGRDVAIASFVPAGTRYPARRDEGGAGHGDEHAGRASPAAARARARSWPGQHAARRDADRRAGRSSAGAARARGRSPRCALGMDGPKSAVGDVRACRRSQRRRA